LLSIERRICCIVIRDEKWIYHENSKGRKSWMDLGHLSTSTSKEYSRKEDNAMHLMLCYAFDDDGIWKA